MFKGKQCLMNGYDSVERKVESKEKLESNRVGCCSSDR